MPELVTAVYDAALSVRSEEERTVELRAIPWNVVGSTREGRERIRRGAFRGTRPEDVALEAIGPHGDDPGVRLVGRAVTLEDRDDGLYASFRVSRTRDGDELLELARDRVYRGASVVFEAGESRIVDGVIERRTGVLRRVGLVERGAYPGAEILAVRSIAEGHSAMPNNETPEPTPPTPPAPPTPDPEPTPDPRYMRVIDGASSSPDLLARMEELRTDLTGRMATLEGSTGQARGTSPLARWDGLVEYVDAAYQDPELAPLLARVLADQLSSESPGVIPPSWATEVAGIIARRRPAIDAVGGPGSLGSSGMEYDYPYLDPALNLDTIVAKQTAEKAQIASVKVKLLKGTAAIDTYAGGSDVSYQLIRRSSPAYREAYIRILMIAYARTTEAAFEAALIAGAGSTAVLTATATADQVRAFLFAASATVEDATGAPATVDLVSSVEFARLGGLANLWPAAYGTANVAGTAQASTLAINISGLPVVRAPFLTGNIHIVTNGEAARWLEDGPFPISAEDVAKLGQNVAVWGMGTSALTVPKGIVKSTLT